ncbi:hypothetical protein BJX63DRAFT_430083 [Aspergillus granulosus]|uniref:Uncharacterized protein n=1 Tax=Aspergillus granulosus TaxID=176169 RepID=A0ABR4HMI6_9EURO
MATRAPPTLILLLPWMGAIRRQVESYIRDYIGLYTSTTDTPTTTWTHRTTKPTFLVIYSKIIDFILLCPLSTSAATKALALQPALIVLNSYAPEDTLVHIFSTAGPHVPEPRGRIQVHHHHPINRAIRAPSTFHPPRNRLRPPTDPLHQAPNIHAPLTNPGDIPRHQGRA